MALPNISLAEFNRIASGEYNAGQIDFQTDRNGGVSLVKVNNHIHQTSKNDVTFDRQRILDIKETFIAALERGGVKADSIREIRANLGLPVDFSASEDAATVEKLMENRFKPLSRDTVRTILDTYAKQGRGFNQDPGNENSLYAIESAYATAHMSAGNVRKRNALNAANEAKAMGAVTDVATAAADVVAMLSGMKSLAAIKAQRDELDMLGKFFELFASKAGKKTTKDSLGLDVPKYLTALTGPEFGGGRTRKMSDMFKPASGTYTVKVRNRISSAANPLAEAEKLVNILDGHADRGRNRFADAYSLAVASMLDSLYIPLHELSRMNLEPPKTFATGLTDILLDNFDALQNTLTEKEKEDLKSDTVGIAWGELGVWVPLPDSILNAMKEDAAKSAGDKDYKVDIGV